MLHWFFLWCWNCTWSVFHDSKNLTIWNKICHFFVEISVYLWFANLKKYTAERREKTENTAPWLWSENDTAPCLHVGSSLWEVSEKWSNISRLLRLWGGVYKILKDLEHMWFHTESRICTIHVMFQLNFCLLINGQLLHIWWIQAACQHQRGLCRLIETARSTNLFVWPQGKWVGKMCEEIYNQIWINICLLETLLDAEPVDPWWLNYRHIKKKLAIAENLRKRKTTEKSKHRQFCRCWLFFNNAKEVSTPF